MADDGFKLPGSSLEELEKVIDAYAQKQGPVTNEDLSKITGMNKADVSRNNGFLSSVELIEGGRYKSATELGKNLGRALHHQQPDEIRRYWHKTVTGNQFLSEQLTAVRVQKGVAEDVLPSKILYNAGASKNNRTKAGARAVVDILVKAGLLTLKDGKYVIAVEPLRDESAASESVIATTSESSQPATSQPSAVVDREPTGSAATAAAVGSVHGFSLAVNLQLQLPEFEDPSKYEDLFKALRKYLLPQSES